MQPGVDDAPERVSPKAAYSVKRDSSVRLQDFEFRLGSIGKVKFSGYF